MADPQTWMFAALSVALVVMNYVFSSGRFSGSLVGDVKSLRERVDGLEEDVRELTRTVRAGFDTVDNKRHELRREITQQQAAYWNEMTERLKSMGQDIGNRLVRIEHKIDRVEQNGR